MAYHHLTVVWFLIPLMRVTSLPWHFLWCWLPQWQIPEITKEVLRMLFFWHLTAPLPPKNACTWTNSHKHLYQCENTLTVYIHVKTQDSHCALDANVLSLWFSQFTADINPSFTVDRPVLGCVCSLVSSTPRSFKEHTLSPTPWDLHSLCCW